MAPVESTPHSHATVPDPLANAKFSLNSLGVAGFFGGDIAVNGMATVIFFIGRRFGGLYNTPGSLEIARRYGQLADSRVYRGLFPGDTTNPAQLFGLDGKDGPKFLGARSGSLIEKTGHLGYLIARMAKRAQCEHQPEQEQQEQPEQEQEQAHGREQAQEREVQEQQTGEEHRVTTPGTVTVIDLDHLGMKQPNRLIYPTLQHRTRNPRSVERTPLKHYSLLALFPVITSIGACVGSALVADWWSFGCILLGVVANGCACFVLGSGVLAFKHPKSAETAPRGDGILWAGNDIVVIRGFEGAVNTITRGRFFLQYGERRLDEDADEASSASNAPLADEGKRPNNKRDDSDKTPLVDGKQRKFKRDGDLDAPKGGKPNGFWIGIASLLLTLQFLVQLLLIPQATLFGQLMFVCTLAASGAYNAYLSSINREDIQTEILRDILGLNDSGTQQSVRKFEFDTWTSTSTFACLALQPDPDMRLPDSSKVLNALIPNDTDVWNEWKAVMKRKLRSREPWNFTDEGGLGGVGSGASRGNMGTQTQATEEGRQRLRQEDKELLDLFIIDAQLACERYHEAFP